MTAKQISFAYNLEDSVEKKIEDIVKNVYGGLGADFSDLAKEKIDFINKIGYSNLPVIIAKTQFSLSDDKDKIGRPSNFKIFIRDIEIKTGAGFIVAIAGDMMLMPGLSKIPNAEKIDIDKNGIITGLS